MFDNGKWPDSAHRLASAKIKATLESCNAVRSTFTFTSLSLCLSSFFSSSSLSGKKTALVPYTVDATNKDKNAPFAHKVVTSFKSKFVNSPPKSAFVAHVFLFLFSFVVVTDVLVLLQLLREKVVVLFVVVCFFPPPIRAEKILVNVAVCVAIFIHQNVILYEVKKKTLLVESRF
jgi:hypothetical protein